MTDTDTTKPSAAGQSDGVDKTSPNSRWWEKMGSRSWTATRPESWWDVFSEPIHSGPSDGAGDTVEQTPHSWRERLPFLATLADLRTRFVWPVWATAALLAGALAVLVIAPFALWQHYRGDDVTSASDAQATGVSGTTHAASSTPDVAGPTVAPSTAAAAGSPTSTVTVKGPHGTTKTITVTRTRTASGKTVTVTRTSTATATATVTAPGKVSTVTARPAPAPTRTVTAPGKPGKPGPTRTTTATTTATQTATATVTASPTGNGGCGLPPLC